MLITYVSNLLITQSAWCLIEQCDTKNTDTKKRRKNAILKDLLLNFSSRIIVLDSQQQQQNIREKQN